MVVSPPVLSVVVPVGSVGLWFDVALRSIRQQGGPDLEIVLVLDGPGSAERAAVQQVADEDARVIVLELGERSGAGAARNAGTLAASGEYLVFADADDIVPPDAYEHLLTLIEASGSDVVSGRAEQFTSDGRTTTYWTVENALWQTGGTGLALGDTPQLVFDHTPWNKVFRRAWLVSTGIEFPTGTTCEDVSWWARVVTIATVDVLPEVVYRHRRHDASVTSGIARGRDLSDWIVQTRAAVGTYKAHGADEALVALGRRLVRREAWTRVRGVTQLGSADALALVEFVRWVESWLGPGEIDELSRFPRTAYALLREGDVVLAADFVVAFDRPVDPRAEWVRLRAELDKTLGPDDERASDVWRERLFRPVIEAAQSGEPLPVHPEVVVSFWDEFVGRDLDEHEHEVLSALREGAIDDVVFLRRTRRVRAQGQHRGSKLTVTVTGFHSALSGRLLLEHENVTAVLHNGIFEPGTPVTVHHGRPRGRLVVELRSAAGRVHCVTVTIPPSVFRRALRRAAGVVGSPR